MRRWPPILWLLVYIGSLLILNGSNPDWQGEDLALGIGLTVIAFGGSLLLAFGPWRGRVRPGLLGWLVAGVGLFYVVCGVAAWVLAGPAYGIATLIAGIIPATAVALTVAAARSKTVPAGSRPDDVSIRADDDPLPAQGIDEERPMGDTPEVHGDLSPHDLPKDHPGRKAAERQSDALGAPTPGHRDGAATPHAGEERFTGREPDLVGEDEADGARVTPDRAAAPNAPGAGQRRR
jgi:hypothetical protein